MMNGLYYNGKLYYINESGFLYEAEKSDSLMTNLRDKLKNDKQREKLFKMLSPDITEGDKVLELFKEQFETFKKSCISINDVEAWLENPSTIEMKEDEVNLVNNKIKGGFEHLSSIYNNVKLSANEELFKNVKESNKEFTKNFDILSKLNSQTTINSVNELMAFIKEKSSDKSNISAASFIKILSTLLENTKEKWPSYYKLCNSIADVINATDYEEMRNSFIQLIIPKEGEAMCKFEQSLTEKIESNNNQEANTEESEEIIVDPASEAEHNAVERALSGAKFQDPGVSGKEQADALRKEMEK